MRYLLLVSALFTVAALADEIPTAPGSIYFSNVEGAKDTDGEYVVNWGASSGNLGYYILREGITGDPWSSYSNIYAGAATSFPIQQPDGSYSYFVKAVSPGGYGSSWTGPATLVVDISTHPVPTAPGAIFFSEVEGSIDSDGSYNIHWGESSGNLSHYILKEGITGSPWSAYENIYVGPQTSHSVVNMDGSYSYFVRAVSPGGHGSSFTGPATVVVNIATSLPSPTGLTSTTTSPLTDEPFVISWDAVPGSDTYQVKLDGGLVESTTNTSSTRSHNTPGLKTYAVAACNVHGCSPDSGQLEIDVIQRRIIGELVAVNDNESFGWACDLSDRKTKLDIEFYATHVETDECIVQPDGERACLIHTDIADQDGLQQVAQACNGNAFHAFYAPTPFDLKNGGTHKVYAWASNPISRETALLDFSPVSYKFVFSGSPGGWDYGITQRCVKTPLLPGTENYFEDLSECDSANFWSLAIQAETSLSNSCLGPATQSLPWSDMGAGPLQFWWSDSGDDLTANLKTDISKFAHPCTKGEPYNWAVFGESLGAGAGPLPRADKAGINLTTSFSHSLSHADTRFFVSCAAHWDGHFNNATINLIRTFTSDALPHDPEVIQCYDNFLPQCRQWIDPDTQLPDPDKDSVTSLSLDGVAMGFSHGLGTEVVHGIHCGSVFRHLVERGYFPPPSSWENSQLTKVWVGHEMQNHQSSGSGSSSLSIKSYRIEEVD